MKSSALRMKSHIWQDVEVSNTSLYRSQASDASLELGQFRPVLLDEFGDVDI
ncbi:MAG: hypothetical protein ACXWJK_15070 [Burkholderiaceae bacterium]